MNESDTKLQSEIQLIQDQNSQLARRNDQLESQIKDYGELFMVEKSERKEWQFKAERLQDTLSQRMEEFNKEKALWYRKYYSLWGACVVLVLI